MSTQANKCNRYNRYNMLSIGPAPVNEACEQPGPRYNYSKALSECQAFLHQLQRAFPASHFWILEHLYDFDTCLDVVAIVHQDCPILKHTNGKHHCVSCEAGYLAASNPPQHWDSLASEELLTAKL